MAKAVLKPGQEVMPVFASQGMVRPTPLQRRKIRMKAAHADTYNEIEQGEQGWFRKYAAEYKQYQPARPQQEDSDYQQGVKIRSIRERARELAGEETGGVSDHLALQPTEHTTVHCNSDATLRTPLFPPS